MTSNINHVHPHTIAVLEIYKMYDFSNYEASHDTTKQILETYKMYDFSNQNTTNHIDTEI